MHFTPVSIKFQMKLGEQATYMFRWYALHVIKYAVISLLKLWCTYTLHIEIDSACKRTKDGSTYLGSSSTTGDGETCLPWIQSTITRDSDFIDGSKVVAENFCRNPTRDPKGPWCHTATTFISYCDVPSCGKEYTKDMLWSMTQYALNGVPVVLLLYNAWVTYMSACTHWCLPA
jgi:hypothetical protein